MSGSDPTPPAATTPIEAPAKTPPGTLIDAPPPLLGTWPRVYLLVVISQGVIIALLALLTHIFD